MAEYKVLFGITASVLGIAAYIPYIKSIFSGRTKPHIFTWLIWALSQTVIFFAQVSKGAGAGAWVTGLTSLLCLFVFLTAFFRGEKNITALDSASLAGAILGIVFWIITKNPVSAAVLVTLADFLGYVPTFRKAYFKPEEEAVSLYEIYFLTWLISMLALKSYNLTTLLYPVTLAIINLAFVLMSFARTKYLNKTLKVD